MRCLQHRAIAWPLLIIIVIAHSMVPALAAPSAPGSALTTLEEKDRLIAEILQLDTKLALLHAKKAETEALLAKLRSSLKDTQQEKSQLVTLAAEEKQNVGRWLRFLAEEGSITYLDVLLGAADLTDFLTRLDILITIIESNVNSLQQLQVLTQKIEVKEQEFRTRERDIASAYAIIKRSVEEAQQVREAKSLALKEAEKKLADFPAILALSQAWEHVLPDIDRCLQRLSKLPWNTIKPDKVNLDYLRGQAEITFKESTLADLLNRGLSQEDKFNLRCQPGFMILERPALDYSIRFTISSKSRRLVFEPHSVTVGDTQVPDSALELLFKDRDLGLNVPLMAGLEIADAEITGEGIRIFLKRGS
jgi:hypothetical protein